MKLTINFIVLGIALITTIPGALAQQSVTVDKDNYKNRSKAESNTEKYVPRPAQFNLNHFAVVFEVQPDNAYTIKQIERRKGKAPHYSGGELTFMLKSIDGSTLGTFQTQNIFVIHGFDGADQQDKPLPPGTIAELPIPDLAGTAIIELNDGKSKKSFTISDQLKRAKDQN